MKSVSLSEHMFIHVLVKCRILRRMEMQSLLPMTYSVVYLRVKMIQTSHLPFSVRIASEQGGILIVTPVVTQGLNFVV